MHLVPNRYYYLATLLPSLQLGEEPELSFEELQQLMPANLSASDYAMTRPVGRLYDIENMRALWNNQPLDPHGNLSPLQLEEALAAHGTEFPEYVNDFLDHYSSDSERLQAFPALVAAYFREEEASANGFLKRYLEFERHLRLILVALRAKSMRKDLVRELQFEDPKDDVVVELLAQKEATALEVPHEFEDLMVIYEQYRMNPLEWHRALLEYRLAKVEMMMEDNLFSVDRIVGYLIQVALVERWNALDKQAGTQIVDTLLKEIK